MIRIIVELFIKIIISVILGGIVIHYLLDEKCSDFMANGIIVVIAIVVCCVFEIIHKKE